MTKLIKIHQLYPEEITSERFQPYGQLILPAKDGKNFDETDAQLKLDQGIPRFYIMRLHQQGHKFHHITRHVQCTQCLGALEGKHWFMVVSPPSEEPRPSLTDLQTFRIPGNCFIKLEAGTWHAGPYFEDEFVDFYNLELSDTNLVDHFTYNFLEQENLQFEIMI